MKETPKTCAKCGSPLVQLIRSERHFSVHQPPMVNTTYRCTDDACQAEIDKRVLDIAAQKAEREARSLAHRKSKAQST